MVGAGGTRTCVHPHVSRPLYHCATDSDTDTFNRIIAAQWEGRGDVGLARYELALLPPCPTIRAKLQLLSDPSTLFLGEFSEIYTLRVSKGTDIEVPSGVIK